MEPDRPTKRVRQACEQCRRKKGRCSGERPACRTCTRLGQSCFYYGEPLRAVMHQPSDSGRSVVSTVQISPSHTTADPRTWDERFVALESTVNHLVGSLHSQQIAQLPSSTNVSPQGNSVPSVGPSTAPGTAIQGHQLEPPRINQLSDTDLETVGKLYSRHCACQPLLLFPPDGLGRILNKREDSTLSALLAVTLRHVEIIGAFSFARDGNRLKEAAQGLAMDDIARGDVRLSTLQTLCLIILLDLDDCENHKALPLLSLASMLASTVLVGVSAISSDQATVEERRCCYWSLILLRRLLGFTEGLALNIDPRMMPYPTSCSTPPSWIIREGCRQAYERSKGDNGIMVFILEKSEEWAKVMTYIRHFLNSGTDVSPWLTTSRYNTVLSGVMSIETRLQPDLHRIKHINFRELTSDDFEACREYWAPWLLSRFMYHTMICLINHPLLIILQLQGKRNDSELFRQQTSFYAAHHVRWVLHFIAFIEARGFRISDPVLGYCAAVVATIELQLLFSVDEATATKKKRNIESCRRLIRRLIPTCPTMAQMIRKLDRMEDMMSTTFAANADASGSITVDLSRIRDILDICSVTTDARMAANGNSTTTFANQNVQAAQWTRLSRRPSVDLPDDGGSPAPAQVNSVVEPRNAFPLLPSEFPVEANIPATLQEESPARADPAEFPANLFFNGISHNESTWWNAFECYDPDWPTF